MKIKSSVLIYVTSCGNWISFIKIFSVLEIRCLMVIIVGCEVPYGEGANEMHQ